MFNQSAHNRIHGHGRQAQNSITSDIEQDLTNFHALIASIYIDFEDLRACANQVHNAGQMTAGLFYELRMIWESKRTSELFGREYVDRHLRAHSELIARKIELLRRVEANVRIGRSPVDGCEFWDFHIRDSGVSVGAFQ